jgi:hypothetical protein
MTDESDAAVGGEDEAEEELDEMEVEGNEFESIELAICFSLSLLVFQKHSISIRFLVQMQIR